MKLKHINLILLMIFSFSFSSCEDDAELNQGLQILENDAIVPPYVWFTLNGRKSFILNDENSSISFDLNTASGEITSHKIEIRKSGTTVDLLEITEFPATVTLTGSQIAAAFGENYSDYTTSTQFTLIGSSIDGNGIEVTEDNLHPFVRNEAQNAYTFFNLNNVRIEEE